MIGRVVVLDELNGRPAAALVVDGQLEDLLVDPADDTPLPGAIYRAVADRPMKGQGGMFVRLPGGSGFLRQTDGIAPGQRVIVQVTGPAEPGKALPVSTRLLFKSRFAIVTPGAPGLNISRRIKDEDLRAALASMAAEAMAGAESSLGLILRSACGPRRTGRDCRGHRRDARPCRKRCWPIWTAGPNCWSRVRVPMRPRGATGPTPRRTRSSKAVLSHRASTR